METFGSLIESVVGLFQIEFSLFGFTFSLWQVFLFDFAAAIVCFILSELFLGN